jgi:predicted nucleotidyltransferase
MGDDDLDFAGWDLKKALQLAQKSNPSLHDWLATTDAYFRHETYYQEFKDLCIKYFDPNAGFLHFWSMATGNFERISDASTLPYKKYFYVLRSLLCARYVRRHLKPAPCLFQDLLDEFYPDGIIREEIDRLLELKKSGTETQITKRNEILHKEIVLGFTTDSVQPPKRPLLPPDELNEFFRRVIQS